MLRIGALMPRSRANGPGWRYVVWTQGCLRSCPGCQNPQFADPNAGTAVDVAAIAAQILQTEGVEGLTFSGGEPFEQARACAQLASKVRVAGLSVVCYTGYLLWQLESCGDADVAAFLAQCDALIDGPYVASLASSAGMVGSANQRLFLFSDRYTCDDFGTGSVASSEYFIGGSSVRRTGCAHDVIEHVRERLRTHHGILLP